MGNQNTNGRVIIEVDKAYYSPGETLSGSIILQIDQQISYRNKLELRFLGYEESMWWQYNEAVLEDKNKMRPDYYTHQSSGKRNIINQSILVHQFDQENIVSDTHKIDFKFQIPIDIPGTYYVRENKLTFHSFRGKIAYQIQLNAFSQDNGTKDLIGEQEIKIVEVPNSRTTNNISQANEMKVYTCCCMFKGTTLIYANLNKNQFQQGQTAIVQVAIDNTRSQLGISRIEIIFRELSYLRSDEGKQILHFINLNKTQIPGIKSGETISQSNGITINLPIIDMRNQQGYIQPAVSGQLVRTLHEIQVLCIMDGCFIGFCKPIPCLDIPITIQPLTPDSQQQYMQIKPQNNQFENTLDQQLLIQDHQ